jgi:uncharacterized protein (DUF302 family)
MSDDGLVTIVCRHPVKEAVDRLEAALRAKGVVIFARIDHAAGAAAVDMPLRPTELLIFGNPKAGTPLMQEKQTVGLDLPLKILAWEDAQGRLWLTYNAPEWLARRHRLGNSAKPAIEALSIVLTNFAKAAAE